MFFNPQMMGQNGFDLPKVPTVKELWKKEKTDYRHWVILFGIALLALTALSLVVLILNIANINDIADKIYNWYKDKYAKPEDQVSTDEAKRMVITQLILPNGLQIAALLIGVVLFISTIIKAYKQKNFARISQWATFVVGLAAFMSLFNLFELIWRGGIADYTTSHGAGIFSMVFYILSVLVWIFVSVPLGRIRRAFIISERVEKLQQDPQFMAAKAQFEAMMGQAQGAAGTSPFGPSMNPNAQGAAPTVDGITPAKPEVSPERKRLEGMSLANLKKVAKELSISGSATMKKDELIEAILRVTEDGK